MPIAPSAFPELQELSNGERAISVVFNRPLFALSTRTEALKTLLEAVEGEVVDARGGYTTLQNRLDDMFGNSLNDSNIFLSGGAATWSKTAETFTHGIIALVQPQQSYNYTIAAGTVGSIADGDALYVELTRDSGNTALTLVKAPQGSVPIDTDIYVLGVRHGDRLWIRGNGEFENEETREIGDGLTSAILGRLGMSDEMDSDSHFTNTTFINIGDTIPSAISKHDLNLEYLVRDRNILLHGGGNVSWNVAGGVGSFGFDSDLILTVPSVGDVTISATTVTPISDQEVVYLSFIRTGSNYTTTLSVADSATLPLSYGETDKFVIGYRNGTDFVFRNGDTFTSGESKPLGTGGAGLVTYQNMSLYASSEDDVSWDATSGVVDCVGDLTIHFPWETFSNTIQSSEFPLLLTTSGNKAYVVLDRSAPSNLTVVDNVASIPITYSQPDALLIAERVNDSVYLFGNRYNDGDIRRIGEGFVAGEIYDETFVVPDATTSEITLPVGGEHLGDDVTLKVWGNGNFLQPNVQYIEGPGLTKITAKVSEMFPDGYFTEDMRIRFRIESTVSGGAGGGTGGTGINWNDPVDADIIPTTNNTYALGSGPKGFEGLFLADRIGNGDVYELYMYSGSLQIVKV